ncbi:MAG: hypothetical protein V7776_16915 [Halopseudomonas aestusnigri]
MKNIILGFATGIILVTFSYTAIANTVSSFDGLISPSGCRSSQKSPFRGTIVNGHIKGVAAKGQTFDWDLDPDGSFKGELFLRNHKKGKKMQLYKGRVDDGKIVVKARFGVPGYSSTFCTGTGEFLLTE